MALINQLLNQLGNIFKNLPVANRVSFILLLSIFLAAFGAVVFWGTRPDYELLYANLSGSDASSIVSSLKEKKVSYKLEGNGSRIYVPAESVYDIRMELAAEGVPKGDGIGFEIFDKNSFGLTDFVQKVNYQRSLQGELERTISRLDSVETVRIHLAIPEKSLFLENAEEPKASVVIKLKPGMTINQKQVRGIVNLVSGSVERLKAQNVTVIDSLGNILSNNEADELGIGENTLQMEYKQSIESSFEKRIQTMLERVVGKNNIIARVTATLDFQRVELTEEKYDPDSPVVRSEQISEEKTQGSQGQLGGQSNKSNEVRNYEINKTVSHQVAPSGTIKTLSVAVLINGSYKETGEAGKNEYMPRTNDEMKKFSDIVRTAVGFNQDRGDKVEVVNVPFETVNDESIKPAGFFNNETTNLAIKYGVMLVLMLLTYFLIIRPLIAWMTKPIEPGGYAVSYPMSVSEIERRMSEPAAISGERASAAYGQRNADFGGTQRDKVLEMAKTNPEITGKVIKGWLNSRS
ncbi:MAG: flagellar M-ring protein FliF [Candidatus Schekmanbacteria bacterium]|nr:flagellar M-ring protein FliF [Candidatus Schekmanbacteria bacterium]